MSFRGEDMSEGDLLQADGLESAVIGLGTRCSKPDILVYDVDKVIEILMTRDGMDEVGAWEFFHFNIEGAWMGESTPIWMYRLRKGLEDERISEYIH